MHCSTSGMLHLDQQHLYTLDSMFIPQISQDTSNSHQQSQALSPYGDHLPARSHPPGHCCHGRSPTHSSNLARAEDMDGEAIVHTKTQAKSARHFRIPPGPCVSARGLGGQPASRCQQVHPAGNRSLQGCWNREGISQTHQALLKVYFVLEVTN